MANPTIKAKAVLDTKEFSSSLNKLQHDLNGLTKAVPGLGNAIGLLKNPITLTVGALAGLGKMFADSAVYGDSFARACGMWDGALRGFQNSLTNLDFSNMFSNMKDAIELGGEMADTFDNVTTQRAQKTLMDAHVAAEIKGLERQYRLDVQNGMSRKDAAKKYNIGVEKLEPDYMQYVLTERTTTKLRIAQLIKDVFDQGGPERDDLAKKLGLRSKDLNISVQDVLDIINNEDRLYIQLKDRHLKNIKDAQKLYSMDNGVIKGGIMQFYNPIGAQEILDDLYKKSDRLTNEGWKSAYLQDHNIEYTADRARELENLSHNPNSEVFKHKRAYEQLKKLVAQRAVLISTVVNRDADEDSKALDAEFKNYLSLTAEKKVGLESYKKLERPEKEVKTKSETKAINVKPSTLGLTPKELGLDKDMLAEIDNSKEIQEVSELEDKLRDELDVLNQILSVKQQLNDMGIDTSGYEAIAESDEDQLDMLKTRLVLEKESAKDEEEKKKKAQQQRELVRDTANEMSASFSEASTALGQFADQSEEAAIASKSLLIASAIGKLVAQFAVIPKGTEIWSWIAGTVAGTATLVATIASLKSFQTGGIVHGKGTAYSDSIPIMVSDGEMMLNPLQQTHLFDILNHPGYLGGGTPTLRTRITGNNIDFILDTNERFKSKLL